jgi:hypothetical protein
MGFPGSQQAEDISALQTIMARESDPIGFLKPFYQESVRRYKTTLKDFWLTDWAITGVIPEPSSSNGAVDNRRYATDAEGNVLRV